MAVIENTRLVKVISITDSQGNPRKDDWRSAFIGTSGVLYLVRSEKEHPGELFIIFDNPEEEGDNRQLRTSVGRLIEIGDEIEFTTLNSVYTFRRITGK